MILTNLINSKDETIKYKKFKISYNVGFWR